jgi:hypothetical protein
VRRCQKIHCLTAEKQDLTGQRIPPTSASPSNSLESAQAAATPPIANALVRAWRSAGLFCEDPIDSRTTHAECRSDGAGGLTASVHPLRQSDFRLIQHLRLVLRITNRIEPCLRTSTFRDIELVDGEAFCALDNPKDTEPLSPVTVPKTPCVLTPSTSFVSSQEAERLNPILGAAAVACLGAEAPQRRSYGRRRSERQARQVTCRRRRAFWLLPLAGSSGLGGGW